MNSDEIRSISALMFKAKYGLDAEQVPTDHAQAIWLREIALQLCELKEMLSPAALPRGNPHHFAGSATGVACVNCGKAATECAAHEECGGRPEIVKVPLPKGSVLVGGKLYKAPGPDVRVYDAVSHVVVRMDRWTWDERTREGTRNPNWIQLEDGEDPPAEPLRCSDCKERVGQQHKPSCYRQGVVTRESAIVEASEFFVAKRFLETAAQYLALNLAADQTDMRAREQGGSFYPTPRPSPVMLEGYSAAIPILREMVAHAERCKHPTGWYGGPVVELLHRLFQVARSHDGCAWGGETMQAVHAELHRRELVDADGETTDKARAGKWD